MKKYLIYTSVFALAACGGGSGGGHSVNAVNAARTPVFNSSELFSNTENNSNVTQMQTQVIVDSGGHVIDPNNSRRAGIRAGSVIHDTNGNSYNVYDLSDVKLNVADEVPAWLKIELAEDGAIQDITLSIDGVESKLAREGNTNTFRGPMFEYIEDTIRHPEGTPYLGTREARDDYRNSEHWKEGRWAQDSDDNWYYIEYKDEAVYRTVDTGQTMADLNEIASDREFAEGHWNRVDERIDVQTNKHISEGDANAIELQYSDFGHFNPVYRTKHKDLNETVLNAIREYGADIEAALLAEDTGTFNDLKTESGLNRDGLDKYRTNEEFEEKLNKANYQLFAGGYAIDANGQLIESGTFEAPRNTTFTGKGIGRVYTRIEANLDSTEKEYRAAVLDQYGIAHDDTEESILNAGHDIVKEFKTNSATLEVKANGDQELVMNFPDFYKVTATQLAAGGTPTIEFDKPDGVTIEKQYMRTADVDVPEYTDEVHRVTSNGTVTPDTPMFQSGYYGVGTVSEAAGLVRYAETAGNIQVKDTSSSDPAKTFTREFEFQGAYGMKK